MTQQRQRFLMVATTTTIALFFTMTLCATTSSAAATHHDTQRRKRRYLQINDALQISPPSSTIPISPTLLSAPVGVIPSTPTSLPFVATQVSSRPSEMPSLTPSPPPPVAPVQTIQPTKVPTKAPTRQPSQMPVRAPTGPPTKMPTKRPTQTPTNTPTNRPTQTPTPPPTFSPSSSPSAMPVPEPSSAPSALPTLNPTNTPTESPTVSLEPTPVTPEPTVSRFPSPQPSFFPSATPTNIASTSPSLTPSQPPSHAPSLFPSIMPSNPLQGDIFRIEMVLRDTLADIDNSDVLFFQSSMASHVTKTIEEQHDDSVLIELAVRASVYDTERGVQTMTRRLQTTTALPLKVSLSVTVEYRSLQTFVPKEWVASAFNSDDKRREFINRLKQRSYFQTVEQVELLVNGENPTDIVSPDDADKSSSNTGVIAGIAAGAAVVLAVGMLFVVRHRRRPHKGLAETTTAPSTQMATEILVNRGQDDVSTLGDPVQIMTMGVLDRDERTASIAGDSYYKREYLGQPPENSTITGSSGRDRLTSTDNTSGGGPMGSDIFDDDEASLEQQYNTGAATFDVTVPAGKLGMVIDTPNGSIPMIHALKADSVLAGKVHVGDKLLSVDEEDVTKLTAVQVSKLISLKSKQERVLVFRRGRGDK